MTRAPLPGKLPEFPAADLPIDSPPSVFMRYYMERGNAWESRARLAVEALWQARDRYVVALGKNEPATGTLVNEIVAPVGLALKAICPLPEEDRT